MEFLRTINFVFAIIMVMLIEHTFEHPQINDENQRKMMFYKKKAMFDKCIIKYPLSEDVKRQMVYDLITNRLPKRYIFKCFMKCAFEELALIDDNGAMNKTKLFSFVDDEYIDMAEKVAKSCLPTTVVESDTCQTAFNFVTCAIKVDPTFIPILAL